MFACVFFSLRSRSRIVFRLWRSRDAVRAEKFYGKCTRAFQMGIHATLFPADAPPNEIVRKWSNLEWRIRAYGVSIWLLVTRYIVPSVIWLGNHFMSSSIRIAHRTTPSPCTFCCGRKTCNFLFRIPSQPECVSILALLIFQPANHLVLRLIRYLWRNLPAIHFP